MFLKSLTLKGFKSFADSTTLDFEPGVTVVVGPNGSGKSNIVDAVAWVLGAQGPRALRSARMDDVIFAGTPGRPALGRAEVSLTIDNTAGQLPIDFSEVTITRTLFRSGDSEYAINRVPCRLLDVTDLLSDTGVGRQQHVIVSQGNLDSVLNARPEDRRLIVEEAAGILKFRRRRERAERRLESTEASVTRLGDLQREVRRQLRPLQRQAEAARRHGDLAAELTALRRFLAGRDLAGIEARLDVARARRAEMVAADDQICHRLRRADAAIAGAEAEISTLAQRNDQLDLAEALSRAEGLRARGRGLAALVAERRRSVERAQAASVDSSVVASLEAEAAELALQLDATEAEAAQLAADAREVTTAEEGLAEDACPAGVQAPGGASGGLAGALAPDPGDLERVRAEHAASGPVVGRAEAEWQRLGLRSTVLAGRGAGIDERIGRLSQVRSECEEAAGPLHLAEGAARSVLAGREAEMRSAESSRRAAAVEHDTCSARAEGLAQALDEARARAGAQRLASTEGYVGTLPELVDVHPGLEAAFEAAAREAVAAVVVDGVDGARRALGELDRLGAGGAVVPLPPPATGAGPSTLGPGLPAGARPLRPLVRTSLPAVAGLLDTLLGPAVVVDGDWSEAAELASRRPELTVVTPAGDRLAGGVWRTG
ncbi:MAG: AAA family ATPase, partial [Acidimicrobiales bacterium]